MLNIKSFLDSHGEDYELTRGGQDLGVVRGLKNTEKGSNQKFVGFVPEVDIQVGDWLEGKVTKNVFYIRDITSDIVNGEVFQKKCFFLTKVEYEEKKARERPAQSIVYNLNGANTRVNNHSTDHSMNVVNASNHEVFDEIKKILSENVNDQDELRELRILVNNMESTQNTSAFTQAYQKFVTSAANHITILTPFIPALTQMITS
ncbi:hypothetical protein [Exiguobacterium artemiae]|uniref:hypothetical protein n=1 Tax=Exiguobacterium artemiae TaxID=340145 RepID=UPI0004799ABF|nr:hypothetical protein [Exiguobacterium sibiricum]